MKRQRRLFAEMMERRELDIVLFVLLIVPFLCLSAYIDAQNWCKDRWYKPWRLEWCRPTIKGKKLDVMVWKDFEGVATLDEAIKRAVYLRRESQWAFRIRKIGSRDFIMADIL